MDINFNARMNHKLVKILLVRIIKPAILQMNVMLVNAVQF